MGNRTGEPITGDMSGQLMPGMPKDPWGGGGSGWAASPGLDLGGHTPHLAASIVGAAPGRRSEHRETARLAPAPAQAHTYFTRAGDRRAVDAQTTHAAGRGHANQPRDGRSGSCTLGTTLPPRLGAVSFLLRPRVSALGANELRRRARRGLHDTALRGWLPSLPCSAPWRGARRTPVLSSCLAAFSPF